MHVPNHPQPTKDNSFFCCWGEGELGVRNPFIPKSCIRHRTCTVDHSHDNPILNPFTVIPALPRMIFSK